MNVSCVKFRNMIVPVPPAPLAVLILLHRIPTYVVLTHARRSRRFWRFGGRVFFFLWNEIMGRLSSSKRSVSWSDVRCPPPYNRQGQFQALSAVSVGDWTAKHRGRVIAGLPRGGQDPPSFFGRVTEENTVSSAGRT